MTAELDPTPQSESDAAVAPDGSPVLVRDEADLRDLLAAAGLAFDRWLDRPRGWFAAQPV